MLITGNLRKTVVFFCGFLFATIVWAEQPDITTSVKVRSLPTLHSALPSDKTPVTLSTNSQTREIAEKVKQSLQTLKQQRTKKTRVGQKPGLTKAANRNLAQDVKVSSRSDGSVRQMRGGILEPAVADNKGRSKQQRNDLTARNFLRRNRHVLGIKSPDRELYLQKQESDHLGRAHLKYAQRYQGLPVWPSDIIVHFAPQGHVDLMNGAYAPTPRKPMSVTARISKEEAQTLALNAIGSPREAIEEPIAELIFYYSKQTHQLAWKMQVKISTDARWLVIVDAISGEILLKYNEIMQLGTSGSGVDLLNQNQSLQLIEQNGTFFMVDTSKAMFDPSSTPPDPNTTRGGIFLLDIANQDINSESLNYFFVTSTAATSGFLPDAVSAAANISQVYDYFLERHNRNSIDNSGGSIFGIVRVGQNFENAFWTNGGIFLGDAVPYAAALDVVAHEVTHGVTERTANLIYQGQSGALNEAFSDIFGEMVEARTMGNDWILGTVLSTDFQRNLRDPSSLMISGLNIPYPSKMSEFLNIESDNGGVHLNSGIINHAYYLLAEGLDNAIGLREAEQIFYRALTTHLVRNSQFIDARLAAITSAEELFGANSIQSKKTAEAFDRVEILDNIASTPPPSSIPAVSGPDATLSVCFDQTNGVNRLCRREESLGDPSQGVFLSQFDIISSRPSISGDGSLATFVDSINDICFINTDGSAAELCVNRPGTVATVAISADGNLFGFVTLGTNKQPDNSITVLDLSTEEATSRTFELVAPAIDASTINNIAFADVMNFTADGRFIIYDALTEFSLLDGTKVNSWNIYALEMQTGQTFVLASALPGVNISNPSLSHTSDNFMTFAVSKSGASSSSIVTSNLNSGVVKTIREAAGVFSVPVYMGDDNAVIFDQVDLNTPTGFSLFRQGLSNDHITAVGETELWLSDGAYGVTYRRGEFLGTVEETGFYDKKTKTLRIHAVDVANASGQITTYEADLNLTATQPIQLRLSTAKVVNIQRSGGNAVFDRNTRKVTLPRVNITDENSNTQVLRAEMNLISDAFDFEVSKLESIQ